jgi:hypothetical protein
MAFNLDPAEENRLLDLSLVVATNYTLRLTSTTPTDTVNGTQLSGNGYAAQTFQVNAASAGRKLPTATITFPAPSGGDWLPIKGLEVWTIGTVARRWWYALPAANWVTMTVAGGTQFRIPVGQLAWEIDR